MAAYGGFQTSTLGMRSQTSAMNRISQNIANVSTGGYKRTDVHFNTMVSKTIGGISSDYGGVAPISLLRADVQGTISSTERQSDIAIVGDGFLQVSPDLAMSGNIMYTRDGSLQISLAGGTTSVTADDGSTIQVENGYLTDKNGYFLLGWAPDANGGFSNSGALTPMRIDQYAFINQSTPTSTAKLTMNLPAQSTFQDPAQLYNIEVVDSNGNARSLTMNFNSAVTENEWALSFTGNDLLSSSYGGAAFAVAATQMTMTKGATNDRISVDDPATGVPIAGTFLGMKAGDPITIGGSASVPTNDGTYTIGSISSDFSTITLVGSPLGASAVEAAATASSTQVVAPTMVFTPTGSLSSASAYAVSATWSDGSTATFNLDVSDMSQFTGALTPFNYEQDGNTASNMKDYIVDGNGVVKGTFTDGTIRSVYKIALARFSNPNGLESGNGMVFMETAASGTPTTFGADTTKETTFIGGAVELSNVDLVSSFSTMIQVQHAYNSSATAFKTADEMLIAARDLI